MRSGQAGKVAADIAVHIHISLKDWNSASEARACAGWRRDDQIAAAVALPPPVISGCI